MVNIVPAQDDLTPFQRRLRGLPPVEVPRPQLLPRATTDGLLKIAAPQAQEEGVSARVLKTALRLKAHVEVITNSLGDN